MVANGEINCGLSSNNHVHFIRFSNFTYSKLIVALWSLNYIYNLPSWSVLRPVDCLCSTLHRYIYVFQYFCVSSIAKNFRQLSTHMLAYGGDIVAKCHPMIHGFSNVYHCWLWLCILTMCFYISVMLYVALSWNQSNLLFGFNVQYILCAHNTCRAICKEDVSQKSLCC